MNIEIQNWWNAKVHNVWNKVETLRPNMDPEEVIKKNGHITICTIVIDGKVVGSVDWDGKKLTINQEEAK